MSKIWTVLPRSMSEIQMVNKLVTAGSVIAALRCYVQPAFPRDLWKQWEFHGGGTPGQENLCRALRGGKFSQQERRNGILHLCRGRKEEKKPIHLSVLLVGDVPGRTQNWNNLNNSNFKHQRILRTSTTNFSFEQIAQNKLLDHKEHVIYLYSLQMFSVKWHLILNDMLCSGCQACSSPSCQEGFFFF